MVTSLLRRWRLVTPLLLALLSLLIIGSGMVQAASAHKVNFHFWGRGAVLADRSGFADTRCDTGFGLPLSGDSLTVAHCTTPVTTSTDFAGNSTFGNVHFDGNGVPTDQPEYFFVRESVSDGDASVVTQNGTTKGHITTTDNAYGLRMDIICNAPNTLLTFEDAEGTTVNGIVIPADETGEGGETAVAQTIEDNTVFTLHHYCLVPDAGDNVAIGLAIAAGTSPIDAVCGTGVTPLDPDACFANGFDFTFLAANSITTIARADCGLHKGTKGAIGSARALSTVDFNDLFVVSGNVDRHLSPDGSPDQVTTIDTALTPGINLLAVSLEFNEQHINVDGNAAAVSTIGVDIRVTDTNGVQVAKLDVNEAEAAIHCGKNLPPSDPVLAA